MSKSQRCMGLDPFLVCSAHTVSHVGHIHPIPLTVMFFVIHIVFGPLRSLWLLHLQFQSGTRSHGLGLVMLGSGLGLGLGLGLLHLKILSMVRVQVSQRLYQRLLHLVLRSGSGAAPPRTQVRVRGCSTSYSSSSLPLFFVILTVHLSTSVPWSS